MNYLTSVKLNRLLINSRTKYIGQSIIYTFILRGLDYALRLLLLITVTYMQVSYGRHVNRIVVYSEIMYIGYKTKVLRLGLYGYRVKF